MTDFYIEEPTAQDVVDAMRFALMSQKDPQEAMKLVNTLIECAPDMMSDRAADLILHLLVEGALKVSVND